MALSASVRTLRHPATRAVVAQHFAFAVALPAPRQTRRVSNSEVCPQLAPASRDRGRGAPGGTHRIQKRLQRTQRVLLQRMSQRTDAPVHPVAPAERRRPRRTVPGVRGAVGCVRHEEDWPRCARMRLEQAG